MGNYKVEGIVLRARDFGEADRVLTILDRRLGKLEAVAKGIRRPRSSLRGACQPFSQCVFLLWRGRTLDGISQAEVVRSHARLRDDLLLLAVASYIVELADEALRERDPSPEAYELILGLFDWLETAEPSLETAHHVLRTFELGLLELSGFSPSLEACATCGRPEEAGPQAGRLAFSASAGGLICASCRQAADSSGLILLAPGTVKAMRFLSRASPQQARALRLTPQAAKEMGAALRSHILYHFDRRPKSLDFLDTVLGR
ncbi:MAG: DNA repair protein RecO [Bacillota bacterium]